MYHNFWQLAPIATASCSHGCTLPDSLGEPDFPRKKGHSTKSATFLRGKSKIFWGCLHFHFHCLCHMYPVHVSVNTAWFFFKFLFTFIIMPFSVAVQSILRTCVHPHLTISSEHHIFWPQKIPFLNLHFPIFWELDRASHFPVKKANRCKRTW